jgi:hypothetical protein
MNAPWMDHVDWVSGDAEDDAALLKAMEGAESVVTSVGAFGRWFFMMISYRY